MSYHIHVAHLKVLLFECGVLASRSDWREKDWMHNVYTDSLYVSQSFRRRR